MVEERSKDGADQMRMSIVVSGRVQGVGFRYEAAREARRLGLAGWVRNTFDGKVEIVAQGTESAVAGFLAWCRTGPPAARVAEVTHREAPRETALHDFEVRF